MAAALSYYAIFSLPPLLFLIITIVALFFDPATARGRMGNLLSEWMGATGIFMQLQQSLNDVWQVQLAPGRSDSAARFSKGSWK